MASIKNSIFKTVRRPRITEKAAILGASANVIVFEVHPRANKAEIKNSVEKIFDVKVEHVRTMNYMGKVKRVRFGQGRRVSWKKAYVKLAEGSKIDMIEGL